jgi:hypothetical protein
MSGSVEVQITAADPWQPATRNFALPELAWLRTGRDSRVELELEDGSAIRLTGDALLELSDYTTLSTGQRITLLSLDRGLAYFTGQAKGKDALILVVPGAQLTVTAGVRTRLEAGEAASKIAMIEGVAMFSSPAAELAIQEGQTVQVEPGRASRFALYREVTPLESDRWNEERDQTLESSSAAAHLPGLHYGLDDLDTDGSWIAVEGLGMAWKPTVAAAWAPFRNGRWLWHPEIGFTWISAEPWGWLPYHYGRWTRSAAHGWLWFPGEGRVFKPGDAYWLRAGGVAGWGPLAPGETWNADAVPQLYLHANTTYARFVAETREIDPASLERPRESLRNAVFALTLPGPPPSAASLDARRPSLRAGSTRVVPLLAGVTFEQTAAVEQAPAPPQLPPSMSPPPVAQPAPAAREVVYRPETAEPPVLVPVPVEAPVFYPAPVYTSIVVVNPPEKKTPRKEKPRRRSEPERREQPAAPPPEAAPPAQAVRRVARDEAPREERRAVERREEPRQEQPIPRETRDGARSGRQR